MVLYNSYIKNSKNGAIDDLVLIKNGTSYTAFFFGVLWFLYHKMWKESIILLLLGWALYAILGKISLSCYNFFGILFGCYLLIAINATYCYARYLQKREYQFWGCVFGKNEMAKLRFIENYLAKNPDSNQLFSDSILNPRGQSKNSSI